MESYWKMFPYISSPRLPSPPLHCAPGFRLQRICDETNKQLSLHLLSSSFEAWSSVTFQISSAGILHEFLRPTLTFKHACNFLLLGLNSEKQIWGLLKSFFYVSTLMRACGPRWDHRLHGQAEGNSEGLYKYIRQWKRFPRWGEVAMWASWQVESCCSLRVVGSILFPSPAC